MAFQQLYYTSCEHGVGGYAGFQFNAVSEGVGVRTMREVEQFTVYELPSWDSSPADAPVNLCHVRDAVRGDDITAHVVYAGADFSGRAGNYFAHALVTEDPGRDFGGLLPIELWESSVWARTAVDGVTLPVIQSVPPRGSFDRPSVAAFLGDQADAQTILARLLSAIDKAIGGGRSIIIWSSTSTENAYWIAAVSYLLEDARAREMSFFTYTRRPAQCRAHVIGTVSGVLTSPAALADGFRVFDMTSSAMPDVEIHPLADLLARVGVLRAAGLWRQAATLAAGTERSFDQWYPIASAAAALLGIESLPSAAIDAVANWLPEAALQPTTLSAPHVETVLSVLLDQDEDLRDDQLRPLLLTANAAGAIGQLRHIESILLQRAITQLERGRPPRGPTPLATAEAIELAVTTCERLLRSPDAGAVLIVLDWARETRLNPDMQMVERCGREVIGPVLQTLDGDRRVIRVGQAYPAFARGVAAYLAASGPDRALRLLHGVAGELLDRSDLRRYPKLREILLLEEVRSGRLPPVQALQELIELRPSSAPPLSDQHLLTSLWPRGLLTADEAAQLLSLLKGDLRRTPTLELLDDALQPPHRLADLDAWLDLCDQALTHPVCAQLPPATRLRLKALQGLGDMVDEARHRLKRGDMSLYDGLHNRVEGLPEGTRPLLRQYLAYLMLTAPRLAEPLARCSGQVFDVICIQARIRLDAMPPNRALAVRLFQSLYELRPSHPARAQQLESTVLAPTIPRWSRRDKGHVADDLKWRGRRGPLRILAFTGGHGRRPRNLSKDFKRWCKQNAGPGSADTGAMTGGESVFARIRRRRWPGPT